MCEINLHFFAFSNVFGLNFLVLLLLKIKFLHVNFLLHKFLVFVEENSKRTKQSALSLYATRGAQRCV